MPLDPHALIRSVLERDAAATPGPWSYLLRLTASDRHSAQVLADEKTRPVVPKTARTLHKVADCGKHMTPGGCFIHNRDAALIAHYRSDCPTLARLLSLAVGVVNVLRDVAETPPVQQAAAMDDPGRVPCFVNTEWAREAIAALTAFRAALAAPTEEGVGDAE